MRYLIHTTAGLALLALSLAPTALAQQRAPIDQDEPRSSTPRVLETPVREVPGSDQDVPGHSAAPDQVRIVFTGTDQDDVAAPRAPAPTRHADGGHLSDGRRDVGPLVVSVVHTESPHPEGREPGLEVAAKTARAALAPTMTADGRPLDARPGAPVLDEAAPVSDLPHEEAAKTETPDDAPALGASSPNPVERTARIAFTLPEAGTASLVLFDVRGREVATLFEGRAPAGTTAVTLDASSLAAGTYVYVLDVGGERMSRRLQIAR